MHMRGICGVCHTNKAQLLFTFDKISQMLLSSGVAVLDCQTVHLDGFSGNVYLHHFLELLHGYCCGLLSHMGICHVQCSLIVCVCVCVCVCVWYL